MPVSKAQITKFLQSDSIAIAGVSRNTKKFGRMLFDELQKRGYNVIPINPSTKEINGQKCYRNVNELPDYIDALLITTPKTETDKILVNAINKGITNIWVQQHSNTKETELLAEKHGQEIISKKCMMMFAQPVKGIHHFHRSLTGIFGQLPH